MITQLRQEQVYNLVQDLAAKQYKFAVTVGYENADYVVPLGSTTADVQLQEAADYITSFGGGTIIVKTGTYLLSQTLYISSNTELIGETKSVTILKRGDNTFSAAITNNNTGNGSVVAIGPSFGVGYSTASRGENVKLANITLDGNKANQTYTGIINFNYASCHGLYGRCVDYITIDNCIIKNTAQNGFYGPGGGHHNFLNSNWIDNGSSDPAFLVGGSVGLTKNAISVGSTNNTTDAPYAYDYLIQGNYITGARDESISYQYASGVIINQNHIYDSRLKAIEGDASFAGGTNTPGNVIITSNYIQTTGEEGIGIANGDNQKVTISNNQIYDTGWSGISVDQDNESTYVISNNIIDGIGGGYATAIYTGYHAITAGGTKITIESNQIYDGSGHGIAVFKGNNVKIADNTVKQCLGMGVNTNVTDTAVEMISFTGNNIMTVDQHGCYISTGGEVQNVIVSNNIGYGIGLTGATTGSSRGIWVTGASTIVRNLVVSGNNFRDERTPAIMGWGLDLTSCSSVTYATITGNLFKPSSFAGLGSRNKVSTLFYENGNYWADENGQTGIRTVTTDYSFQMFDFVLLSNGTSLTHTLMSPTTAVPYKAYTVRNINPTSDATIVASSGNINGAASYTLPANCAVSFVTDLTNWWSFGDVAVGAPQKITPSGLVNSSNVTYTLPRTPNTGTFQLFLQGQLQMEGVDYSLSGTTITMTSAPITGSTILAYI